MVPLQRNTDSNNHTPTFQGNWDCTSTNQSQTEQLPSLLSSYEHRASRENVMISLGMKSQLGVTTPEGKYPKISEGRYEADYSTKTLTNKNPYRKEKITSSLRTFRANEKLVQCSRRNSYSLVIQIMYIHSLHSFYFLSFLECTRKLFWHLSTPGIRVRTSRAAWVSATLIKQNL